MLALARACGLYVADSRIETVADRDVLLVRRFDRERADTGYLRYRMVSALTLLRAGDSPVDRANWSYLLLADEVRRAGADPRADLRELFGRMCFNAAVSNLDDHPRNHAIFAPDRAWRLSPAFDLTPSPLVAQHRRDLAMTCGRFGRYANRANLLSGCGRFLLRNEEAAAIFERIIETVRAEWDPTMRHAGVSETDRGAVRNAFVYPGLFHDAEVNAACHVRAVRAHVKSRISQNTNIVRRSVYCHFDVRMPLQAITQSAAMRSQRRRDVVLP